MTNEVIFAGFGGQGVLLAGKLLTYAGMLEEKQVSWIPAYGPEMRGGTASCSVIISDEPIGSPIVIHPDILVAMNAPSLHKFEADVKPGGVIIVNSSIIDDKVGRGDVEAYYAPLNDIAVELGNARFLNMIALGALLGVRQLVGMEAVQATFAKNFAKKPEMIDLNIQAAKRGMQVVKEQR